MRWISCRSRSTTWSLLAAVATPSPRRNRSARWRTTSPSRGPSPPLRRASSGARRDHRGSTQQTVAGDMVSPRRRSSFSRQPDAKNECAHGRTLNRPARRHQQDASRLLPYWDQGPSIATPVAAVAYRQCPLTAAPRGRGRQCRRAHRVGTTHFARGIRGGKLRDGRRIPSRSIDACLTA